MCECHGRGQHPAAVRIQPKTMKPGARPAAPKK